MSRQRVLPSQQQQQQQQGYSGSSNPHSAPDLSGRPSLNSARRPSQQSNHSHVSASNGAPSSQFQNTHIPQYQGNAPAPESPPRAVRTQRAAGPPAQSRPSDHHQNGRRPSTARNPFAGVNEEDSEQHEFDRVPSHLQPRLTEPLAAPHLLCSRLSSPQDIQPDNLAARALGEH